MRDWSKAEWVDPKYNWKPAPVPELPPRVIMDFATKCNLRCGMCPVWGSDDEAGIESVEGLKNVDRIAAVPGVGALFPGAGNDLARSLGVRMDDPELEAAFQQILQACKANKIACAITANSPNDVARRVKEGWNIIRSTVPSINAGRALLGETTTQ